jgi:DNA-binding XRE family transcriptional regulator
MPEIRRFGSFKLLMFFQDENPPHVHIKGADFAAKIRISNGDLLAGDAPNKVLRQARRWVEEHRAELSAMWDEWIGMVDDVTRVTKVRPAGGRVLRVRFAGDRRDHKLDMTGLIARSAHFAPLMDDAESFARVVIVEDGLGLAWPIQTKWGRLDVSASTLRRIAEEQEPMTGADFAEWRKVLGLSLTEAAKLLGVGRRTIIGYLKKDELPPVVAIACRALARDKHLLAAHFVPARKINRPAA